MLMDYYNKRELRTFSPSGKKIHDKRISRQLYNYGAARVQSIIYHAELLSAILDCHVHEILKTCWGETFVGCNKKKKENLYIHSVHIGHKTIDFFYGFTNSIFNVWIEFIYS